jgi:hypothetical protein
LWNFRGEDFYSYSDAIDAKNEYNESRKETPTQHYSNLTVPGGTAYTENEISTPLITPSIKGHAQFATDKGIGWFRSDEQAIDISKTKDVKHITKFTGDDGQVWEKKNDGFWYADNYKRDDLSDREVLAIYTGEYDKVFTGELDKGSKTIIFLFPNLPIISCKFSNMFNIFSFRNINSLFITSKPTYTFISSKLSMSFNARSN